MSYTACVYENGKCKFCGQRETEYSRFGENWCRKPHLNPDSIEFRERVAERAK